MFLSFIFHKIINPKIDNYSKIFLISDTFKLANCTYYHLISLAEYLYFQYFQHRGHTQLVFSGCLLTWKSLNSATQIHALSDLAPLGNGSPDFEGWCQKSTFGRPLNSPGFGFGYSVGEWLSFSGLVQSISWNCWSQYSWNGSLGPDSPIRVGHFPFLKRRGPHFSSKAHSGESISGSRFL